MRFLEMIWNTIAGSPDLGPVNFESLKRPSSPNHYLVSPEDYCKQSRPNRTAPVYDCNVVQLQAAAQKAWSEMLDVELVSSDAERLEDRYIHRSRLLRFPDTIAVKFVDLGHDTASLAIYSRSQVGYSDLGANRKRVLDWLSRLDKQIGT